MVSCYLERCLAVWPPEEFSRLLAIAQAVQDVGPEERNMARALTGYSAKVDIDTQWRITVPSFWREYAGLAERPVMVVGVLDRIELWSVELWREHMAPTMEGLAQGTRRLFPAVGPASALAGTTAVPAAIQAPPLSVPPPSTPAPPSAGAGQPGGTS